MSSLTSSSNTNILLSDDFEQDLSELWRDDTPQKPYSLQLVDSPKGPGKAARFELRRDDPWTSGSIRSELSTTPVKVNAEATYRFRMYIPEDWEYDPLPDSFVQWHNFPDKDLGESIDEKVGGPPLIFDIEGDKIEILNRSDPSPVTTEKSPTKRTETIWVGDYEVGEWIDWTISVRWSYKEDGLLQIWKDQELIVDQSGPNSFNDQKFPYMKLGVYKWIWKDPAWLDPEDYSKVDTRVLFYDDVSIEDGLGAPLQPDSPDSNPKEPPPASEEPISNPEPNPEPPETEGPKNNQSPEKPSIPILPDIPTVLLGTREGDRYVGTEKNDTIKGLGGRDRLNGKDGDDLLYGGRGNDTLKGQQGEDKLYGNGGNDRLIGGANDDWLEGGRGRDLYRGGRGCDTFVLETGRQHDIIKGFNASCDRLLIGAADRFRELDITQEGRHTIISLNDDVLAQISRFDPSQLNRSHFILG